MPRAARRCGFIEVMSTPPKRTVPAFARCSPVMTLKRVVLPAPFGPMSPVTAPASAVERDLAQRGQAAEAHRDVLDLEERHRCHASPSSAVATSDPRRDLGDLDAQRRRDAEAAIHVREVVGREAARWRPHR